MRTALLLLSLAPSLFGQERRIDPTWLHRFLPESRAAVVPFSTPSCVYKPLFGEGDGDSGAPQSISRFGELHIAESGACKPIAYDREEELFFVVSGQGTLQYGDASLELHPSDFTYVAPGVKHSFANPSDTPLRVIVMGFRIPTATKLQPSTAKPQVVNLGSVKEQTVDGHPTSVLYKLLAGPRGATRDAIDQAYVVTSLFWMDFAPGGTNFPHHHETAEEIYLLVDGSGEIVAGSGTDGLAGRFPAKPGDAYYFRANCTVGFYNQDKPGAKAHILAVRSRIPLPGEPD